MWSKVSRKVAGRPHRGYVREGYRSSFTGKVRGMLRGMLRKSTGRNRSRLQEGVMVKWLHSRGTFRIQTFPDEKGWNT
jgi:hypothetical protein